MPQICWHLEAESIVDEDEAVTMIPLKPNRYGYVIRKQVAVFGDRGGSYQLDVSIIDR